MPEFTSAVGSTQTSDDDGTNPKRKSAVSYVRVLFETLEKMLQPYATLKDEGYKVGIYHSSYFYLSIIEFGNFRNVCFTFQSKVSGIVFLFGALLAQNQ